MTVTVNDDDTANSAPAFTSAATFDAAENQTAVGTVVASDGDADDSVTGYTIQGGADRSKFSIVEASGVLTFASAPNFEAPADADADNAYVVVVRAASGTGARAKTADQTITVTVTDVAGEAPGVPAVPTVSAAGVTSVTAGWTAPANAGPPITDYDYRYRVTSPQGSWTEVTGTAITALSATITGLAEDTGYDVQVRATNAEGTSGWSDSGSGSTDANAAPAFTSAATFDAAENQTAVGTVAASDGDADDSVTGYTIQGGADRSKFSIVEASGVLTFASAPNFEAPADADADNAYVVVVRAASGTGARAKTADQTITVTVTDVAGEAPGVPAVPTVSAAGVTSVTAGWTAPANAGPPITDYDYRYRVTSPQGSWTEVTGTAITALSATITGLAEDTGYDVQVRATNAEGTSGWSDSGSGSTDANAAPAFTSAATFDAAENQTAVGTVAASDGDADDSVTGYTIQGGADRSKFSIVEASGVLTFASAPNFEAPADADADNAYVVVVRAASGTGARAKTADQTITVTVTDVAGEAPGVPAVPTVSAAGVTSVTAGWTAPANAGPPITDYDYRYRVTSPQGSWTEVTGTAITALSATITGLAEDTGYDVQVRATNAEGTSGWSDSGSGSTDANAAPAFTSAATFDAAENQTAVGTVAASDGDADDSVTGYTIQGGADRSKFSIVEASGVLTFASAPNFEAPADADADNAYVVVVRAASGTGARAKTADQTITVTVTDVAGEAPGVPAVPTVSAAGVTSVTAGWTAPANAGPPITDYDYRYRVTSPQGSWTEVTGTAITALSATITGLAEDTGYDVQVRATNAEGTSGWSDSGSGSTDANAAPAFTSAATFDAAENQTAVGTVAASDGDADDSVTGYTIQGGADRSKFSIVEASGVLTFASAPNFEAPADADADNAYVVVVRAASGTGARAKTADQTITVTVTDVAGEAPGVPAVPTVSAAGVTSVTAGWTAPANAGPPITDYDYRYRVTSPQGSWTEVTGTAITALSATITGLAEDTGYDVQVRATNAEGTSGWSDSGSGSTDANAAPAFTSAATFDAAENQTAVGTVAASDGDADDSVTGYTIQGGADRSKFSIVEASGVLTFASAPNFEAPADADADNAYVVVVRAASGTGARAKTADQTITVTVTDVAGEAPGVPAVPTVSAAGVTSVTAGWTAPANAGPPVTDYDYRYRVTSPQGSWTEVTGTAITALSATITGLAEDTGYDVQVRATNAEGTSGWSDSGSGSTDANAAPAFTSAATFDAAENQTAVGTVAASDGDADDSVTGYTIQGGADRSKFSIVEASGVLTFASAPNFEAPADADADNAYVVVVRAASGTGARAKTADQTITVTVTDVAGEAPGVPAVPTVSAAGVTSVTAGWTAPANAGPPITDYDYRYRVTSPQGSWTEVTGTAITALSATITGLAEDTGYDVQVRATNAEGTSGWSDSGSGSTDANAAPAFTSAATFDAAENQTAVGTVAASDGDADDSVTGYTIQGGADRSKFSIVEASGVLTFASAPNFEAPADADADNAYVVVVRAASGTGARAKTADQTITVTVTDVAGEAPGVPAVPTVSAAGVTSVTAAWTAPANAGPPITDYDYRYRVTSPQGSWTEVTGTAITALSATITGLAEDTGYDVQVRATNAEGTSGWSDSGSGSTDANAAPAFTSAATFDAAENQTAVGTVAASDGDADDSVTGYTIQGGADRSKFSIVEASGVLTFASAPNFEAPADADADNAYVVVVRAASGTGARAKTADQTITVTVTDVAGEAPGVPAAPTVSAAGVTSVTAGWTAPANAGPPITDYDYRYRVTSPQGSWTEVTGTAITALSATITGLAEDTGYDVQVRATNAEGTSGWSDSGSGSTDANAAPAFTSAATFDAAENQTAVGTVVASDGDADDSVTGYTIQGGADRSKFSIVEASGVLTFASAPNFEAPADADADNAYVVVVRAASGTGARAKTADQTITVTVTDVAGEAPGVPAVPTVSAAGVTSVTAGWTAPANAGPPVTDYDYRYRVTSPQGSWTEVTGTAITALSATITGLAEDTGYDVQVRATNAEGTSGWSDSGSGSTDANAAPAFTSAATFDAAENQTAVGTVAASDGDADDSVTGYTIQGGADRSKFSIVEASGVLTFASAPNFEAPADADADNAYVVVVRAASGTGARAKTADQTITVTVTDVAGEAPGVPAVPTVSAAGVTSVTAAWTAPANAGPPITDYDYRYRVTSPQGSWTEVTGTAITALSATITGLAEDTGYDVQVRATNAEGTSGWSDSGSGSTDANAAPAFTSAATFDAAENQTAVGTVAASDGDADDSVTGYTIQGGADRSKFSIVEASGVLTFASAPNFEAPADADADNAYVVVVRAASGTGARAKTADQTITVTVTDVAGEAPGVPAVPTVSAAGVTSVTAAWTAPANAGPPVTDYDYRYRVTSPQGSWTEVTGTAITALSATITGLAEDTGYDVQVRATNAEGTSGWSDSGSGSTDANAAPAFTSAATFDAAENQTAVGTVVASDGDADDSVTGYTIQGGADRSKFSIVEASGALTFASAPNFEAPADADADNAYVVVVRAASGTGARAKTADQTITVTVTDVAGEAPGVPAVPTVSAAGVTSVTAGWTAPANAGPPVTDYDYRYRVTSPQGSWTEVTGTAITALSATITGLAEDTGYDVQVRATNAEGTSGWSDSGSGSTDANAAPAFTSAATFDAAENQTAVGTVAASDGDADDSVTGYTIQGGADRSKFSIVEASGVLTFASAPNFEAPADADADNAYVVVVRAASGTGARAKTADQTITVTVTDVAGEAPGVPAVPTVSAAGVTSVTAGWTAPANAGPPVTDYDYRYRVTSPQGSWTEVTGTAITALSATITGLAEDTGYDVQVRATNDEGTSGWSASGSGSTDVDGEAPGVRVSKTALTVTEQDTTGDSYTVVLDSQPTADVTIAVGGHMSTDVNPTPASLTFTTMNWETVQTVTVKAVNDADTVNDTVSLTHTATSTDTDYSGITIAGVTVTVNDNDTANTAPTFPSSTAMRSVAENTAAGQNVGAVLTATDSDGDTLTYTLEGTDAASFDLVTTTDPAAQIRTKSGVTYNHEAKSTYTVVVKADDGNSGTDTVTVTISITDVDDGELRLEGGPSTTEGRLEVFHDGEWGTVCDDQFDKQVDDPRTLHDRRRISNLAPQKACQFMGYATGEVIPRGSISMAPSAQQIWLDDVRCLDNRPHWTGSEPTKLHHCYHAGWGLNNCTHDEDVHLRCVEGLGMQTEATALTASFEDMPQSHDGSGVFTFRIAFSEDVDIGRLDMKDHALTVTGGTVKRAKRVDGRSDLWEFRVEPSGTDPVSILVPQDRACTEPGALCTADGQMLTAGLGHSVPAPAPEPEPQGQQALEPLAASFVSVPAEHDGETEFWLELTFDAAVAQGSKPELQALLGVTGGTVKAIRRKDDRLDQWRIKIQPSSHEAVTVTLSPSPACGATGAVCTEDGRTFTTALATQIQGPPGLAVADAEAEEAPGARLVFTVTLNRAASGTVTVTAATSDGTAVAGEDYVAKTKTVTFAAGETSQIVRVRVLDDAHDEGAETMTLTLSSPSGAYLADGTATGTITNTDHMPQAWMARFGRTVADQVLDAVEGRMTAPRAPGTELSVAGQRVGGGSAAPEAIDTGEAEAGFEALAEWLRGEEDEDRTGFESRPVTGSDVLTGTSFAFTEGSAEGGFGAVWGRGAISRFDGREGDLTLDGEVASAMVGADWTGGSGSAGLAVAHSRGEGDYRSPAGGGAVESTLTGVYPYGRYDVSERLSLWGVVGYGTGTLTLTPEGQAPIETDMDLSMAAVGGRSVVVRPPADGGLELAATADAMVVQTASDEVRGSAGSIAASEAEVTRVRFGFEGTWRGIGTEGGGSLVPGFEIGVRQDGGDAETGFGADIGAGIAWSDPAHGIAAEVRARGLLTHEDGSFRERGFAGSFAWDPDPASDLGPSLTLRQTVGASATGGADALLAPESAQALIAANDEEDDVRNRRLEATLGYGIPAFGGRYTTTPAIGFGLTEAEREYSHSWRLAEAKSAGLVFGLDVEGTRRESVTDGSGPEHVIGIGLGWRFVGARREDLDFELRVEGSRLVPANDDRAPEDRIGLRMSARW